MKWCALCVFFFFFYKNPSIRIEAEIKQNFRNVLSTFLRLRSIKNVFILPICKINDTHKIKVTNT